MRVRVGHLLPSMAIGGRERIVADLCRSSRSHGMSPQIITYDSLPPDAATVDAGDTPIIALDRRAPDFAARLRALDIDVMHAQGHVAAAIAPALPVPMVTTLHVALGNGWRWLPAIRRGLRRSAAITAVSSDLADRFAWLAGNHPRITPTGVDLTRFNPHPVTRADSVFTIGVAARLHPVKRHVDLIAAIRRLQSSGHRVRLLVAGEGAEGATIRKAAVGLDVVMLGAVADMASFYRTLDVFALVSDHEGTPAALLEAMACGCACIVTNTGGMPAALGDTGILVPRRNPAAVAAAIAALIDDVEYRRDLGRRAADRARDFSLTDSAESYADLYRAVLTVRAPRGNDSRGSSDLIRTPFRRLAP